MLNLKLRCPGAIKMWRPLSVTTDFCCDNYFLCSYFVILEKQMSQYNLWMLFIPRIVPNTQIHSWQNAVFKCQSSWYGHPETTLRYENIVCCYDRSASVLAASYVSC
jgi:hypothetical protein